MIYKLFIHACSFTKVSLTFVVLGHSAKTPNHLKITPTWRHFSSFKHHIILPEKQPHLLLFNWHTGPTSPPFHRHTPSYSSFHAQPIFTMFLRTCEDNQDHPLQITLSSFSCFDCFTMLTNVLSTLLLLFNVFSHM